MKAAEVEDDIRNLEQGVQQDYLDQVAGTVKRVSIQELEEAIRQGDESRIEELLLLGLFSLLTVRLRVIYIRGATKEVAGIKIPGVRPEMNVNAPAVNDFLSGQARAIQQQAAIDQVAAVRAAIAGGLDRGESPRKIALNIAGRVSKQTGVRSGGVVGLSGKAAKAVDNARDQLSSGDPAKLKQYLTRIRRDPAFDAVVKAAIASGKPIPKEVIDKAAGAYADRLLITQAETIAQTNTAEAYNQGRDEGWRQLTARSNGAYTFVKTWVSMRDQFVRGTHQVLNGQVVEKDQSFISPSGARLMFPGDTSLGAPMYEIAMCRCVVEYSLRKNAQVTP